MEKGQKTIIKDMTVGSVPRQLIIHSFCAVRYHSEFSAIY